MESSKSHFDLKFAQILLYLTRSCVRGDESDVIVRSQENIEGFIRAKYLLGLARQLKAIEID